MSNLQLRVISALVLAAVTLGLTWLGGLPFRFLCTFIVSTIFYEWSRMARPATGGSLGFLPEALLLAFIGFLIAGVPASWLLSLVVVIVVVTAASAQMRGAAQWDAAG
ncbi:phosphatidate cytidylyltransferase, partial [Mesorhizobium sp. M4B.F.Ca.ET.017.02.2.1]